MLIKLLLNYQPEHYVYNKYSLLTAIKLRDIPLIKLLLPYTNIDFITISLKLYIGS